MSFNQIKISATRFMLLSSMCGKKSCEILGGAASCSSDQQPNIYPDIRIVRI